jgi:hypothetical protein
VNLRPGSPSEPAQERAEHEARLGGQGEIGGHADDDAERQTYDGSNRYGRGDAHGASVCAPHGIGDSG